VERDGPLPLEQVLRLLREALSALAHAHGFGLVHRDIKPENLLIAGDGSLHITDFGLALALRGKFGGATSQSGTPQFASPEQLLGERVDQRSDLYSLAAVAYYALLGLPPFPGLTPEQVLAKQTTNQLPDAKETRQDVSEALEEVLERALSADVEARYASAAEFLQAVNRAAESGSREPVADWACLPSRDSLLSKCSLSRPRINCPTPRTPARMSAKRWRRCSSALSARTSRPGTLRPPNSSRR
jgi:serine/threonine protein kinase